MDSMWCNHSNQEPYDIQITYHLLDPAKEQSGLKMPLIEYLYSDICTHVYPKFFILYPSLFFAIKVSPSKKNGLYTVHCSRLLKKTNQALHIEC